MFVAELYDYREFISAEGAIEDLRIKYEKIAQVEAAAAAAEGI
jgi:hypothetical protein